MFNADFYPTPTPIIEKLIAGLQIEGNVFLEPSSAPEMYEILLKVSSLLSEHQKYETKILAGYTLAANLGNEATDILNRITKLLSTK